jgi:sarcosine oxidase
LYIERQVLFWFETNNHQNFKPDKFPIYIWEYEPDKIFYGFPDIGDGLKTAFYHGGEKLHDASTIRRKVSEDEVNSIKKVMSDYLPGAGNKMLNSTVCMYTNTPDLHFLIDFHPDYNNVIIASPCSGHGFKFSTAIGEMLKDLVISGKTSFELEPFKISRLF